VGFNYRISSNAFLTQEWSDVARDDVSRLRLTLPLVSFLVGWLIGCTSDLKLETAWLLERLASVNQSTRSLNPKNHNHNRHRRKNFKSHQKKSLFSPSLTGHTALLQRIHSDYSPKERKQSDLRNGEVLCFL
jgi:hypothetical protein